MKKLIAEVGLWFIWVPFRRILCHLPLQLNYFIAHLFSRLAYLVLKRRREIVMEEITNLFGERIGEKEIQKIVKKSFDIFCKRQVENFLLGDLTKDKMDEMLSVEGIDNLEVALQKEKGVILLLSHFGSFLLPLPFLGNKEYNVIQVVGKPLVEGRDPIHKKLFERKKRELDKLPVQFIVTDRYLGPIIRTLKNNGIVVIAFDGRTGNKWIPVRLFNRTAQFSPGPFNLAIKTGATILPTFVVRERNNKHKIIFEPAMKLEVTDDKEETLKINTIKYAKIFERYILKYPCHFAMILYSIRNEAEKGLNRPLFVN